MMKRIILFLVIVSIFPVLVHAQVTNYCNNQIYQTFEGSVTNGTVPTAAQLQASNFGGSAVTWVGGFGVTQYSSVDMKALVAPGRLCGDSQTYQNLSGSHSLSMAYDGNADFNYVEADYAATSNLVVSFEYNEDFVQTDASAIDAVSITNAQYGAIAFNAYGLGGSRSYGVEVTGQSITQPHWNPSQLCPCKVTMQFHAVSGTDTITLTILDKNGALVAGSPIVINKPTTGTNTSTATRFGDQCNCGSPTAGKHTFYDNVQISFDGSLPGQFCKGVNPTWTSSPDATTLQSCLNGAGAGSTVNVLSGTTTWDGAAGGLPITDTTFASIIGGTTCTGTGTASASCVDSTQINMVGSGYPNRFLTVNCPASGVVTVGNLTFNWTGGTIANSNDAIAFSNPTSWIAGTQPPVCFRITQNHFIANNSSEVGGAVMVRLNDDTHGVVDHNFYERSAGPGGMFEIDGDRINRGYNAWLTPWTPGSQNAWYLETNTFIDHIGSNTEGPFDGYGGCRVVFRFNYGQGTHQGGSHGTDSGPWRGCMATEDYGNTWLNNINGTAYSSSSQRSGTGMYFKNSYSVSNGAGAYGGYAFYCYRCDASTQIQNDWGNWNGFANGTKWQLNSASVLTANMLQSNFPNWVTGTNYLAYASVTPTSGNPNTCGGASNPGSSPCTYTTYSACTSAGSGPTWPGYPNFGASVSDGGCTWVMSGGSTASGGPYGVFCGPTNLDTLVAVSGSCPGGDTSTFTFDPGAGTGTNGYPIRDQNGRIHTASAGQVLSPIYLWLNPGGGTAFTGGGLSSTLVQECREYYQDSGTFTGATCAHNTGVGSGLRSSRPVSCVANVAWWSTDQGSWNTSGNGFGQGVLDVCAGTPGNTGSWVNASYTPLVYPHPLVGISNPQAATPQFTPLPGGYTDTTVSRPPNTSLPNFPWGSATITPTATIMDNTPGATICYTTNGTPPTATTPGTCDALSGEVSVPAGSYPCASTSSASGCAGSAAGYNQFAVQQSALAAVPVNHVNTTIKAIATAVGYTNSTENDATYIIDAGCTAPTIVGSVTATTGLDSALVPPVNDSLTFITLSFTTSIPTNAKYEIGGINVHTPYQVSAVQDTAGATSHSFTFTGLLPATINWGYGVTASTVIQSGPNAGQVCGSGSQAGLTTAYTSGSGTILASTAARSDTTTSPATAYRVPVRGSHHVTAGYSAYFAVDFVMVAGINPPNGSLTMTITGEPLTGTSFNWMSVGTKATSTGCTNQGIFSTDGGDVLSKTNVCNDTNKLNTFISGVLPGREIQLLTSPTTPPGNYTLTLTMSNTTGAPVLGCTVACNSAASTFWNIIVDPPTAPFGVSTPKQAPASFPAIPNQVVYTNRITEYGQNYLNCAQDGTTTNNTIRPNDNSTLLTVGPAAETASWYYDGVNTWFTGDSLRQNWAGDGPAGTMLSWSQCRQDVAEMYRDNGVLAGFGGLTNTTFSQGFHDDYLLGGGLGGKALDLQEVTTMVTTPQSPLGAANANYMDIDLRAVGYNMRSYIHGVHLGLDQPQPITSISGTGATGPFSLTFTTPLFNTTPPGYWPFAKKGTASQPMLVTTSTGSVEPAVYNTTWLTDQNAGAQATASFQVVANMPSCGVPTSANCGQAYIAPSSAGWGINSQGSTTNVTPMRAFLDYNLDHVISQMEQACITQDPTQQNWEFFFLGTSARELIEYYNLITPDPRIPPIIKTCADYLWTQFQKQPTNVGTWFYVQATQFDNTNLQSQGGTNCNSPEDALNVPMYSWLYQYYGLPIYQQEGDYLFGLNATFSTGIDATVNGIFAQLPGGCYNYFGPGSILNPNTGATGKDLSQGMYWGPQLNYVTARNPQFNIFPGSVGVFNVTQGQPSSAQIITLSNPVNPGVAASKVIGNATVTGTDATRFVLTQTGCGNTTLAIGSTCQMSIVFTPASGTTVVTAYGGTPIAPNTFLNIPVGASTYKVPLYGTGVNGYTAQPTLLPLPGSYGGTQSVKFTSQAGAQICLATSNGNLSTGNGNIVGTGGGTCFNGITPIASGSSESVPVTTTFIRTVATAPGYANSVGLPSQTFTITNVPTATLTPNPLNFPSTNINTTSAPLTATITNTGSVAVVVTQAQVFSTNFSLVNGTCFTQFGSNTSFTLPVGGSCTWGITFSPTATISYVGGCPSTNCFAVTDNATGSPQTINLNGTGTQATIVWSSPQGGTTYNYGNIVVGTFNNSNPLTLQNTGTGPLNVAVTVTGTNAAQFSILSSTCPGILPAGNSCTFTVTFTPAAVASYSAALTETDSLASNSPQNLTLSGAGVAPPTQQVAPAPWVIIARRKGR